ncbi:hypothetical protein [Mycolicibacterium vaccae]|nr:hypothetical protein [Mycolicibacterium vaccae]MCV7059554.1 hypothetical protein [Mycolicibacterium vaccae]
MHTPSVTRPGRTMYRGLKSADDLSVADARQLLANRGIRTVATSYRHEHSMNALRDLVAAVGAADKLAVVGIRDGPEGSDVRDVVVARLDVEADSVVIDSGAAASTPPPDDLSGEHTTDMSLDAFMLAWRDGGFELAVAELVASPESRAAPWRTLRPRREVIAPERRRPVRKRR